jgi:outer membrane protein OmpA-like peptidoglycan-associated protein
MQKNPQLTLEVGYHTDSRTDESISWRPSESRAESMVDYLVRKGIDQERLYAKGYGDSEPIIDNKHIESLDAANREAAHAVNRRTEFKIICTSVYSNLFFRQPDTFLYSDSVVARGDLKRLNLLWEPNGVELLPESMVILDSLILFLQTHPNLTVEIGCHSDSRGQEAYNQKLTDRRINCVQQHLEKRGANMIQVYFRGYGESQPIVSEKEINQICTILIDKAHNLNRRAEIKILRF